jgi:membrane protease YdiL (CAAX protease family)
MMALWGLIMTARTGRWEHAAHNIPDVTVAFTSVFAGVALAFIPLFLILERVFRPSGVKTAVVAGVLLGAVGYLSIGVAFGESEDPQTVWGWVRYWAAHPRGFASSAAPFMAAGGIFGFAWMKGRRLWPPRTATYAASGESR